MSDARLHLRLPWPSLTASLAGLALGLATRVAGDQRNALAAICGDNRTKREHSSYKKGARVAPSALVADMVAKPRRDGLAPAAPQ